MPIASSDLKFYGAANHAENDTSTQGGAIATATRVDITQWTSNAVAAVVSDGADTRTVTITGRLASGAIDTEALVLNGTTEVAGAKTWERVLKVDLSTGDGSRTVTVRQGAGGATRATLGPNETKAVIFFQRSASAAAQKIRYEKMFGKNTHGSLTLNEAAAKLTADPDSRIRMGLPAAVNDSGSVTNRLTAPGGVTFVDDNVSQSVPGGVLAAGDAIGIWVEQDLPADDAAHRTTFTVELSGTTV